MPRIDQFESVFRSAVRAIYTHEPIAPKRVLAITDLSEELAASYAERVAPFIANLGADVTIEVVPGPACAALDDLLRIVEVADPDIIATYRCVHSPAWKWPYTIGDHIEVLTQVSDRPVLLLPRVDTGHAVAELPHPPRTVLAMTDHLAGDSRLVNWAAAFAGTGKLVLAHVEDDATFERYMGLIGKSPNLDTDVARRDLGDLVLREPRDWVETCTRVFAGLESAPEIDAVVTVGHRLETYAEVVATHGAELLVLNTKDEDQLAMHGLAYPLIVELRHVPMLLL